MNQTKIYGHRGAKGRFPENTLLSFQQAILQGVDGIELDIHLTKDGEVIVIHDEFLNRTTDGTGFVRAYTLEEIKQFSAGSKFSSLPDYEESWIVEKVPTLKEVLQLLVPYDIELNIELKTYTFEYEGIEEKTLALVNEYGNGRKVVYSSFHLPTLLRIKAIDSSASIAWLLNQVISNPLDYIKSLELEALHLHKEMVIDNLQDWQELRKLVRVWTVNQEEEMTNLIDAEVEAVITDYPELAIAIRQERAVSVE
ncbi:glycerophosphodiester phosphodiesterase [Cytobacillus oceanisediminis]|uniref:Glycerophosphodiester phosphodiesterase n=2 Tax=Niallia TaxID=2837506 RepID=A0A941GKN9_NIACI|nr:MULTISPECIES: glycerophosphodiester phosphodiesterase [Bacillaceae]EOR27188.1 glycerophosphoryl diester phosphodiesterase [Niallia nealsonii AAU1]MBQ6446421.1 glycerophosphodiester phosphodiesterase [Bacillus sp. (in: firmicutes)]MDU1846281.1 glycerophosphodiester phosphodiesterase [Niallia nealsonii]MBZ9533521.1 glycerophosphodiester phosphodiesterase [Cytobacillus oceanisediminis]MCB5239694.1 glycerophosphodiester phosphodiesterase [Niallia circulans]